MAKNIHGGGANTNKNGLHFEQQTDLVTALKNSGYEVEGNDIFYNGKKIGLSAPKHKLYKLILEPNKINYKDYVSKQLLPDEALYIYKKKSIFIIEKKFQKTAGSVDEKIQTCGFKLRQYKKLFKPLGIKVNYFYVLCNFYDNPKYNDVLEYIEEEDCQYFFNDIPLDSLNLPHND